MAKCIRVRVKKRELCIGDLDTLITIQNRDITPPVFNNVDFGENFSGDLEVWSGIETVSGKTYFDGVNTETPITHKVYMEYDSTITSESWILLENNTRLDILRVNDLDEQHEWLELVCVDRGLATNEASKA